MTIESDLASISSNLKRIADSLDALVSNQGIVADVPGEPEPEKKPAPKKKGTSKKAAAEKKAPAKKKATKKKAPAKKAEKAESTLTIKDDVRPILKQLRDEVSHDAVKALLKKFKANTIQDVDPKDYERLIEMTKAELGVEEDDVEEQEDMFDDDLDDEDDDL